MKVRLGLLTILVSVFSMISQVSWAGAVITYHGRILDSNDHPVEAAAVTFRIRIYSPNPGKCLLYEESRTISMVGTQGVFVIPIGDGIGNRSSSDPGITLEEIFANNPNITFNRTSFPKLTCNTGGHTYTPSSIDQRQLLVSFDDNSGTGEQTLPITDIGFVPLAVSAYDAQNIGGTPSNSVVRLSSGTATPLSPAQFSELLQLTLGSSTTYSKSNQLGGSTLPALSSGQSLKWNGSGWSGYTPLASESDPSVKSFAKTDLPTTCGTDKFLRPKSDGSGFDCIAPAGGGSGTITGVTAGTGLSGGGTTGTVTVNLSDVGTAGSYYKVTTDSQGRVTAGQAALTDTDIPALPTSKITTGTFADSMLAGISVDKILNGASKYFNYKPANTACANNEILKYDTSLNAGAGGWKCAVESGVGSESDPTVQAFAKNTVSTGLTVNGSNQLQVDVGTTANKILRLDGAAKLPAVDGSQLTNLPTGTSFSGSLSGDVTGTQGATVVSRINGVSAATAVAGDDQKFMRYVHGSGWQPQFVKLSELRNNIGTGSAFNAGIAGCSAAQTLVWTSLTDQFNCQDISLPVAKVTGLATVATSGSYTDLSSKPTLGSLAAKNAVALTTDVSGILPIANGGTGANSVAQNLVFASPTGGTGAPSFRAIDSSDLPASVKYWDAAVGGINYAGGNVGIGSATPGSKLTVNGDANINGAIVGRGPGNFASNTVVGGSALTANTTGQGNTAMGNSALMSNTTSLNNTAIGNSALYQSTGGQNTALGHTAGGTITTGTNNIAIGTNAQVPSGTASNQISIGNLIYAVAGNVGIGTSTITDKLTVSGTVKANSVRLSWATKTVGHNGFTLAAGENNIFLDVSGGAFSLILPAAPLHGETIKFVHAAGTLSTNNVTLVAGAGDTIVGDPNLILDINNGSIELIFFDPNEDGNGDWRIM